MRVAAPQRAIVEAATSAQSHALAVDSQRRHQHQAGLRQRGFRQPRFGWFEQSPACARESAGTVLAPPQRQREVTAGGDLPLPLRWGEYRAGGLARARWGLLEPPEPWLPEAALAQASLVLVPALAVDRQGVRLGRGRGFYDRSLRCRDPHARLVAVVRTVELVDVLPSEPHDVPMTHALTPERGLIALPCGE